MEKRRVITFKYYDIEIADHISDEDAIKTLETLAASTRERVDYTISYFFPNEERASND